jgi:hypothetical protein
MTNLTDIQSAFGKTDATQAQILHDTIDTMIDELVDAGPPDLDATWEEINAVAEMGGKIVAPATGNLALTAATHGNRIVYYDDADGVISLPAATGTGYTYTVVVKTPFTSGKIWVAATPGTDGFLGGLVGVDDDADAAYAWKAEADDDTITGNGTSTGGKAGDWYEFIDVADSLWLVRGFITQSGGSEATPFSATVSAP